MGSPNEALRFTFPLAVDPYNNKLSISYDNIHSAGQFKVHTQANIYLFTAVSDGYLKRIVGFKVYTGHVS